MAKKLNSNRVSEAQLIDYRSRSGEPIQVDPVLVLEMAKSQCSVAQIAAKCNCSESFIYDKMAEPLRVGRLIGCASLAQRMFESAMSGNVQMMMWLSKQYLGHRDKSADDVQQVVFNLNIKEIP